MPLVPIEFHSSAAGREVQTVCERVSRNLDDHAVIAYVRGSGERVATAGL